MKLKIVMISTLWESTPPAKYGGTERVVSLLTEGLVSAGHNVTLFATGDSKTRAKLVSVYPRALYRDGVPWTDAYWPLINIGKALEYAKKSGADIVHHHSGFVGYPFGQFSTVPMVNTHHGNLHPDVIGPEKTALIRAFKDNRYISISNNQRSAVKFVNWVGTVYNGVDTDSFEYNLKPKKYLAWIGRFTPSKGPKEAIVIAKKMGLPLVMAAKIEKNNKADFEFYQKEIAPLIDGKQIKYVGEVGHRQKNNILKNAFCLINPISWDEPFGLVPVEANASGTPVVTFKRGAMPELIKNGVNGFLVEPGNLEEMAEKIREVEKINRLVCRNYSVENFSVQKMVESYVKIYREQSK